MRGGRYEIVGELGRGGMGRVVRARDVVLGRDVALKTLLRRSEVTPEAEARIVREAQAMAQLAHPCVVPVYDVAHGDDGLYIAMEYVPGCTLSQWLRARSRSVAEILDVFRDAGQGLAAAHDAELVHRDFKPSNVLVAEDGRAKVMDFGLARGDGSVVSDASGVQRSASPLEVELTREGTVLGTPSYMAPEQHRGERVDARADQYAFCVALFEALHGVHPFGEGHDAVRLALAKHSGRFAAVGSKRGARMVPRGLDAVVRRGLAPDPVDRWPTMNELLAAIDRVQSTGSRWASVGLGALAVAGFSAFALVRPAHPAMFGDVDMAAIASPRAIDPEVRAKLDGIVLALRRDETAEARAMLGELSPRLADVPTIAAELAWLDGRITWAEGDLLAARGKLEAAWHTAHATGSDGIAARAAVDVVDLVGNVLGLGSEAMGIAEDAEASVRRSGDPALQVRYERVLGSLRYHAADLDGSQAHLDRAQTLLSALPDPDPLELVMLDDHRARNLQARGEFGEAAAIYDQAIARAIATLGDRDPTVATVLTHRAALAADAGRFDESRALLERALDVYARGRGLDHLGTAGLYNNLGNIERQVGRLEQARIAHERALAIRTREFGADDVEVMHIHNSLAADLLRLERWDEAARHGERALVLAESAFGDMHPECSAVHNTLGDLRLRQHDLPAALEHFTRSLEIMRTAFGDEHPDVAGTRTTVGEVLLAMGRHDEARVHFERATEIWAQTLPPDHPALAYGWAGLGRSWLAAGRLDRAREPLEKALANREHTSADPHELATIRFGLAQALWADRRARRRAVALAEQALAAHRTLGGELARTDGQAVARWLARHRG